MFFNFCTNQSFESYCACETESSKLFEYDGKLLLVPDSDSHFVGIGNELPTEKLTVQGNISASGDLYVGGNDIYGGTTKRITLGTTNEIVGHITSSGNIRAEGQISASGEIVTKNSFKIKQGSLNSGDVILKAYSSGDDGVIDVYQNNAVKSRIHGNGVSYFQGGNVAIGGTSAPSPLTVVPVTALTL